jgi:hypothetical protein
MDTQMVKEQDAAHDRHGHDPCGNDFRENASFT